QLRLLADVEQAITDVETAIGQFLHAADHQVERAARFPVAEVDVAGFGHRAAAVDDLEVAAAVEVRFDDGADLLRRQVFVGEGGNGDRDLVRAGPFGVNLQLRM